MITFCGDAQSERDTVSEGAGACQRAENRFVFALINIFSSKYRLSSCEHLAACSGMRNDLRCVGHYLNASVFTLFIEPDTPIDDLLNCGLKRICPV